MNRGQANQFWYEAFTARGLGWLPVLTGSMAPTLKPGDQVMVTVAGADGISFGDIFLFRRNGEFIVHRALKKINNSRRSGLLEQGDGRRALRPVSGHRVVGRVSVAYRDGKILDFDSPASRATSLVLSAWLYLASVTVRYLKHMKPIVIKRPGDKASRVLKWVTSPLINSCAAVWELSGRVTVNRAQNRALKENRAAASGPGQ
jgi:hypothetical protein